MKFILMRILVGVVAWAALTAFASASETVFHAQIRGTINPATANFLEDAIRTAEQGQGQALVISLDTPGGLISSVEKMAQAIDRSKIPVVVYVEPAGAAATSAGALLLLASHVSAMTPGSHMGAAHPVDSNGKAIEGVMGEKVLNDTASFAEGLAEVRGRNKALAGEIVRKSRSFTASEAFAGKMVDVIADTFPDLLRKLEGRDVTFRSGGVAKLSMAAARVTELQMTRGQQLLDLLSNPNIAAVLMTLAMLLIYFELNNPGVQVAGILGVVCLIIAFMSFQTLPVRTGGAALLVLGAIGLIGEVFLTTHGALALGGTISFVLGLIWVIDPAQIRMGVSPAVYIPAGLVLGSLALLIGWFAVRVKKMSIDLHKSIGGGEVGGLAGYAGKVQFVSNSASGETKGKVLVRGELWEFASEDALEAGDSVEILGIEGLKVFVKRLKDGNSHV